MICIIKNKLNILDDLPEEVKIDGITDIVDESLYSEHLKDVSSYKIEGGKFIPLKTKEEVIAKFLNDKYIPDLLTSIKNLIKPTLSAQMLKDDGEKIPISGLYDNWEKGKYMVGDIRNYAGQTWECHQAHDNAVYPDITPNNLSVWATFWRPLHAKSKETARPWIKPQYGTTDMYHAGEYMVYTDEKVYKALRDTVYSPEEYAADWAMVEIL